MNQSIEQRVIDIIANALELSPDEVQLEDSLDELCEDSLDLVNLLFDLEDEFDVDIPDASKASKTIQEVIVGIEKLLATEEEVSV